MIEKKNERITFDDRKSVEILCLFVNVALVEKNMTINDENHTERGEKSRTKIKDKNAFFRHAHKSDKLATNNSLYIQPGRAEIKKFKLTVHERVHVQIYIYRF